MNFGQAEREGFQEVITPLFGRYLRKCYSTFNSFISCMCFSILVLAKSECHAQALPSSNPVISRLTGDEVSVHRTDWDVDHPSAAASSSQESTSLAPGTVAPQNAAPLSSELGASFPSTPVPSRPASCMPTPPPLSAHGSPPPSLRESPPPSLRGSPPPSPDPSRLSPLPPSPPSNSSPVSDPLIVEACKEESVSGKKRKGSLSSVVDSGAGGENGRSVGAKKRRGMTSAKESGVGRGRKLRSAVNVGVRGGKLAPLTKASTSTLKSSTMPVSAQPSISSPSTPFPSWFTSCSTMLRSQDLGPAWLELVGLWEAFEQQHNFKPADRQSNLPSFKRPPCIAEWLKNARKPSWRPSFKDASEFDLQFNADFLAWWDSLLPGTAGGDFSPIAKPGINGLLSVMAALFFWGASCGTTSAWAERLEDVSDALANLVGE